MEGISGQRKAGQHWNRGHGLGSKGPEAGAGGGVWQHTLFSVAGARRTLGARRRGPDLISQVMGCHGGQACAWSVHVAHLSGKEFKSLLTD